ncbi:PREDICTED: gastrokine-1-like [Nipponia nippon]|uniref:gastrokine-1-like n=1 Tax=Nipponia nippon TaxID=128390 RepID=UPI000510E563|nr:PREDICTED: gastrokine-1-like [Nipponia nippon]
MTAKTLVTLKRHQSCDSHNVRIATTVLLGLLLTPALADYFQNTDISKQVTIDGGYQLLSINRKWDLAAIEEKSTHGSWTTLWNYDRGIIATKMLPEKACFISTMNRKEMPNFDALPRLAEATTNLKGQGPHTKQITFVIRRPIRDLKSYGPDVYALCKGLRTYIAYEVNGARYPYNQDSCFRLDVLHLVGLKYCRSNYKA